jgi:sodium/proline symporter
MPDFVGAGVVFAIYLVGMIAVGVFFFKKADSLSDYFIGGRRLNAWTAALSAHASDMSGWLMLGLIGVVYSFGLGRIWIALGLALGTMLNWLLVAKRLRRYTLTAQYAITIPEYFENRFQDTSHVLRFVSAIFITIFFIVYTASGFVACGTLFSQVFGVDYQIALLIGAVVIISYTFLGGFRAICWTDFIQGLLMLAAIVGVPLVALFLLGQGDFAQRPPEFFNPLIGESGRPMTAVSVISGLAWGLGYFGMPHILIRFMAVKREKEIPRAVVIAGVCVILSLGCAIVMGVVAALFIPDAPDAETVFILIVQKLFMAEGAPVFLSFLGAVFLCGVLAAIMSTADSQLLVAASAVTNDLYHGIVRRETPDKRFLWISRFTVLVIAIIAYIIAVGRSATVMALVSNAWAGFGSAFGALVLLSLYWKRLNRSGAIMGIVSGGLTVIIWDYVLCVPGENAWITLGAATGLYSLAPGFCISLICIVAVSLATKPPSQEVYDEFERAAAKPIFEE